MRNPVAAARIYSWPVGLISPTASAYRSRSAEKIRDGEGPASRSLCGQPHTGQHEPDKDGKCHYCRKDC